MKDSNEILECDKKQQVLKAIKYIKNEIKNDKLETNDIENLWNMFYSKPDKDYTKYLFIGWWLYLMAETKNVPLSKSYSDE